MTASAQLPRELQLTIQVVDEQGKPVSGAATYMEGDPIRPSQVIRQSTDADGKAAWTVLNISGTKFQFFVNAAGFEEVRGARVEVQIPRLAQSMPVTTIKLVRLAGGFVSVRVTDKSGGILPGSSVNLLGRGLFGGKYSGVADARGIATVFVPVAGTYDVDVSNERYETWRGSQSVPLGGSVEVAAALETKKDTSSGTERMSSRIIVTVMSGGKPVPGASVTASGSQAAITNSAGRAVLTGSAAIGDQVEVSAGAEGYVTGTGSALMQVEGVGLGSSRSTVGNATIHLIAGKDNLPMETPIHLVLDLRDSVNQFKAVEGAYVDLRFENGLKMSASGASGADGLVRFTIADSPSAPLAMVRKGIRVEVSALPGRYKNALRSITSDLLEASPQQRFVTVYVDPDNDGTLLTKVKGISDQIGALRGKWTTYKNAEALAAADAKTAAEARARANATLNAILETKAVLSPAAAACSGEQARSGLPTLKALTEEMEKAAGTAAQLESTLNTDLSEAKALIGRCVQNDAQQAKQKHLHAIQMLGQLGVLEKRIKVVNTTLTALGRQSESSNDVLKQAMGRLPALDSELRAARGAQGNAAAFFDVAEKAVSEGRSVTPGIRAELAAVQAEQRRLAQAGGDAAIVNAGAELQTLAAALSSMNFLSASAAPTKGSAETAAKEAAAVEGMQQRAQEFLTSYKGAACTVDAKDFIAKDLEQRMFHATDKITAAADLPRLADECAKRGGPCSKLAEDARFVMKEGGIDQAQTLIRTAQNQGCSVSDLNQELDYFKTIRDAAVYIEVLNKACRYQDALDWARQLPQSSLQWKLVIDALGRSRSGLSAQTTARTRIAAARQAAQVSNTQQMEQNFQAAEQAAAGFSCPVAEVAEARANTRVATTATTTVVSPPVSQTREATYKLVRKIITPDKEDVQNSFGAVSKKTFTFTPETATFHDVYSDKGRDIVDVTYKFRYTEIPETITVYQPVRIRVSGVMEGPKPPYNVRTYFRIGAAEFSFVSGSGGGLGDINDQWTTTTNMEHNFSFRGFPVPGPTVTVELSVDGVVAAKLIYEKQ